MTGILRCYDGQTVTLPVLTRYVIDTGGADACGSFSVEFACDEAALRLLEKAAEFTALEEGQTVFTGVVDEVQISLDQKGQVAQVTGRSLLARLLDNQVVGAEFLSVQLEDILARYVRPFGISAIQADPMPRLTDFLVPTGASAWQVLCGFCRHAAGITPQMLADGTLLLEKNPGGKVWQIGEWTGYIRCQYRYQRYGRISRQILVDRRRGTQSAAENTEFLKQAGRSQKVAAASGQGLRADWKTARQRIEEAEAGARELEITFPGGFLAWPGDRAELYLTTLGIEDVFWVRSAVTSGGPGGLLCTVYLGKEK